MQANIAYSQDESNTLGQILSDHKVMRAVLIYQCQDGSQAHVTIMETHGEPVAELERVKNLTAVLLAKTMIAEIESTGGETAHVTISRNP
jgi:hypothetical protein